MGQTFSLDSTNDQVTIKTTQPVSSSTLDSTKLQVLQGPEGPRGKDAVVDYAELASSVVTNPQLYGVVRDGLVRDPQFQGVVTQYFKDNSILFRGEKGVTDFKSLSFDEKASIVNMIIQQNKDDFVKGFVESQDLKKAIVDLLAKIPEIRGPQGIQGPKGDKGDQGAAGKDAVVDYPKLTQSVVGNSQMLDAVRSGLIVDTAFKGVITKYFQDNAVLFRGEKGVSEFKALSVDEKAAIVTMIVQQNKDEFAKGLADNNNFRQAIINALVVRPEVKGPQGERGVPGPAGPAGRDAVVDYTQLGNVVSTTPAFANSISSGLAGRSDFAKIISDNQDFRKNVVDQLGNVVSTTPAFTNSISSGLAGRSDFAKFVSDNQDLRKNVVDQMSLRNEFKGPQGVQGPVGPAGKDADGFVGMWIAQRFQRGGASDFITNPYSTYGVRPAIETAIVGTMNLDDKCRFTGSAIWQNASLGYNAAYTTRILVTSNFPVNLDNVRGTNPFSIFINGKRSNGQFLFENSTWYTIELFHGVESSGQDAFVELGWNPKNLKQNIGTVVAIMRNGLMGTSPPPAPSTFDASKLVGNVVAGQQVSFDGSLIQDGTIPFQKFGIGQGESLPVRMMPMIPDSKIAAVSAPKITGPGALDYSLLPTINDDKISGISASKIGGAAGSLNYSVLPNIRSDKLVDNDIEGRKIKDGSLPTNKLTGVIGDGMFLDNTLSGSKIRDGSINTSKLTGNVGDAMFLDNSLTGTKIRDGSISTNKLNGRIGDNMFDDNSLTGTKIRDGSIPEGKIQGTIAGSRLSDNSIPESKIQGTIDSSKIRGLPTIGTNPRYESIGRDSGDWFRIFAAGTTNGTALIGGAATDGGLSVGAWAKAAAGSVNATNLAASDSATVGKNLTVGETITAKSINANIDGSKITGNIDGSKVTGNIDGSKVTGNIDGSKITGNIDASKVTGISGFSAEYEQFSKATDGKRSGQWDVIEEKVNSWDPAFRGSRTGAISTIAANDASANDTWVDFTVPKGMKQAYVVYLPWSNCRYFTIYGINDTDGVVFVRIVNAFGIDDRNNNGNFSGVTAASVAGVNRFKTLRIRGAKGRMHLMGVGWTREEGRGMETGLVHADTISGTFDGSMISGNIDAGKITGGTLNADRIPGLDAGKITGGTLNAVRIPGLDAGKITGGTLNADRIPILPVDKIDGVQRLILDGWAKDRFSFANGLLVNGGGWDRSKDGKEPSVFQGELVVTNGNGTYTHFNHRNGSQNWIRGDTQIDGKVTITNNTRACRDASTGWNDKGKGEVEYLDRHNVRCDDHEYLTKFQLERSGNNIRYNFRCCRFNN